MGGGLMQLVAYGAQDVYLTGNPQITFFKVVYRRHTNFSVEAVELTFNGTADVNRKVSCPITRNGDLVGRMYLKATLDAGGGTLCDRVGHALIKSVELSIGGSRIDRQYGVWMEIWDQLSRSSNSDLAMSAMINQPLGGDLFVPLQFFCCRNPGLALPLIALQYHDVRVDIEFNTSDNICETDSTASINNATLLVEYVYLDSEERKRFAQASHEYLIEQLQYSGEESAVIGNNKKRLNFNHPCKELVWAQQAATTAAATMITNYANGGANPTTNAQLKLNGHDRFSVQPGSYFRNVQTLQCHTRTPSEGINVYSFALNPEDHQPSGTCNFSRIDNAELNISSISEASLHIFATNYNVLRVMSGMGGLAYSN